MIWFAFCFWDMFKINTNSSGYILYIHDVFLFFLLSLNYSRLLPPHVPPKSPSYDSHLWGPFWDLDELEPTWTKYWPNMLLSTSVLASPSAEALSTGEEVAGPLLASSSDIPSWWMLRGGCSQQVTVSSNWLRPKTDFFSQILINCHGFRVRRGSFLLWCWPTAQYELPDLWNWLMNRWFYLLFWPSLADGNWKWAQTPVFTAAHNVTHPLNQLAIEGIYFVNRLFY